MRKAILAVTTAAMLAVPAAALQAQQAGTDQAARSWIHIRVDGEDGENVRINLPASLAEIAGDLAGKKMMEEGELEFGDEGDISLDDIRRMWRELRDAGEAEFVEVQDGDEHVRVFREGDRVYVRVTEEGEQKVRVEMPADLVDALLGTEGQELDVAAAMQKLARSGHGELVTVQDEGSTVRIWIDDQSTQGS